MIDSVLEPPEVRERAPLCANGAMSSRLERDHIVHTYYFVLYVTVNTPRLLVNQ